MKGLIMTAESVRAILDGRQTVTRRVDKFLNQIGENGKPVFPRRATLDEWNDGARRSGIRQMTEELLHKRGMYLFYRDWTAVFDNLWAEEGEAVGYMGAPYKVGETVYVKETWLNHALEGYPPVCFYRADDDDKPEDRKWKSPLFMPEWASRLKREIVSVRPERLQDITEDDAEQEGILHDMPTGTFSIFDLGSYRARFANRWDKLHGKKHPWSSNPWVWRIEFREVK